MTGIKLTSDNFISQMIQFGYFAEQIPHCFHSKNFVREKASLSTAIKRNKCSTSPTTLSTYKNELSRRVLSLPNPESFLRVVNFMSINWNTIKKSAKSPNSLSPISFILPYDTEGIEVINSENLRERYKTKSDYINGIMESIRVSLGYKILLTVDIANFYNTIYTHSIAWAICGKDDAKLYFRTKQPKTIKKLYEMADNLDRYIRHQKNDETNGILVGPYTSRVFSEIILSAIDKELTAVGLKFTRYVDDYKFYFRSIAKAQESLPLIEKILNTYNLNLNSAKTDLKSFPYEFIKPMKKHYESALKRDNPIFEILNTAAQMYTNGEKGAYKYALKLIRNKKINEDPDVIISQLINIMLLNPKYSIYIVDFMKVNLYKLQTSCLNDIINNELCTSLENDLQQETLQFVYLIRELELKLAGKNLISILKSDNDFALIIALDIWRNRNKSVIRTRSEAAKINTEISNLSLKLNGETYNGSRWLLLNEVFLHSFLPTEFQKDAIKDNAFFQELQAKKVTFYNSISEI